MIYAGIIFVCLLFFAVVNALGKKKKPLKRAFVNMLFGVLSLVLVNIVGMYCDVSLAISPFSFTAAACGGVPAVAAMVLIETFL